MVDPLSGALLLGKMIDATIGVVSNYAGEKAKLAANTKVRQETFDFEREKLATSQANALELERQKQDFQREMAAAERLKALEQHQRDQYPIADGPGQLRKALMLSRKNNPDILTVLLCPPDNEDPSSPTWSGLRGRVYGNLMTYQNRSLAILRKVDRKFHWVHSDLYEIDLHGIPTLIVQFTVDHKVLDIQLGGCHITGDGVQQLQGVHRLTFPGMSAWTEETVGLFDQARQLPADEADLLELNHTLASRLITVCVVAALDAYYLQRRVAYHEQFDEAVEAAGIFGEDWKADLGIELDLVADPAFHLLHCAKRKARRGDKDGAIEDLNAALRLLAGVQTPAQRTALRLMPDVLRKPETQDHHRAKLREVFELFPENDQFRRTGIELLEEELLTDQGEPQAAPEAKAPTLPVHVPRAVPVPPLTGRGLWSKDASRNPLDDD
ncbi:hypothetical protein ACIBG8_41430 [Nonomuraea sp. NPDC050556]|uniref:hypothetical protein n=1 Tax=Nonomuraea sp. NPDC050556 TaxID=3364369 RepID=UPI0037AE0ED4